jgi:glucosamine--fructose-6-phosphate aminotransferase (isomerizing)
MCGIVAYIGKNEAYPVVIKGLKRLEYRGYDSSGVAINQNGVLQVYKRVGKVSNLEDFAANQDRSGHAAIGHTRWATHGEPSDVNSHPHTSMMAKLPSSTTVSSKTTTYSSKN